MIKKLKVALLGAGDWGKNYIRVLKKLDVLTALADSDESIRNKYKKKYPKIEVTGDYKALLRRSDIYAVVVATPASTHYEIVKNAIKAGKDVLVEKPIALTVDEALELVELAKIYKRIILVGHLLLYKPAVKKMIECICDRVIGDVYFIEMRRLKLGKIRSQENVLWSFAPHDVAVLLSLVNSPVVNVTATGQSAIQSQIEDNVHIKLDFESKVKAHIHISWLWPKDERKTFIVGTNGMLVYDEHKDKLEIYLKGASKDLTIWDKGIEKLCFEKIDALENEVLHFLECVKSRSTPIADGRAGVEVVKVLVEAEKCIDENEESEIFFIHETAYIDESVSIGRGSKIWHYSHIMAGAKIGQSCKIGQNVFIAPGVKIGSNVKIQNNVSVYEGVTLEKDVFCGPSMVFTNTKIPRSAFPRNTSSEYEKTLVKEGTTIGANATIICGVVIGKYAFIAAGTTITKDVPDHAVIYGNPSKVMGWICRCGKTIVKESGVVLRCNKCHTEITTGNIK